MMVNNMDEKYFKVSWSDGKCCILFDDIDNAVSQFHYECVFEDIEMEVEMMENVELIKKLQSIDIIKKHFNIEFSVETEKHDKVWGLLVSIQAKLDKGEWDSTAYANLVNDKEDFEILKEVFGNDE